MSQSREALPLAVLDVFKVAQQLPTNEHVFFFLWNRDSTSARERCFYKKGLLLKSLGVLVFSVKEQKRVTSPSLALLRALSLAVLAPLSPESSASVQWCRGSINWLLWSDWTLAKKNKLLHNFFKFIYLFFLLFFFFLHLTTKSVFIQNQQAAVDMGIH